ncbi:unnamed protein product [Cylicostephanus goldi]|uniref:Uncharacterized protein n=1 Tax=Cylicostephanus goldi TaxID=71465 RepID=A0A3P7NZL1_CYLGO|nr:unnamed protein product [Cylicostephanus goldi]
MKALSRLRTFANPLGSQPCCRHRFQFIPIHSKWSRRPFGDCRCFPRRWRRVRGGSSQSVWNGPMYHET